MFNNPKDVPFAVGMIWALYYLVRLVPELPKPSFATLAKLGLAIGLALGVRVGGLLMVGYLAVLLGLSTLWRALDARSFRLLLAEGFRSFACVLLPVIALAYGVMLIFWPFAQLDPLRNPLIALANFSHEIFPFPTLFDGRYVPANDLPWSYLPVHIALALPELVLILVCAALPVGLAVAWRRRARLPRVATLSFAMVGFAILFPVGYAIAITAVLFDGMRHFIFVLPPIAALAAVLMDRALIWVQRTSYRGFAYAALGLYGLVHVGIMGMLHPDEYVYYNAFIGGVSGADGLFKTDYWANSYAEAVMGLEDYLRAEYGSDYMDHEFTIAVCGPPISADFFFPANFVLTSDRSHADFFIAFTKDDCHKALPGREVYRVERMGVLLSIVLDRRPYISASAEPGQ
jgi:hypothetical protein